MVRDMTHDSVDSRTQPAAASPEDNSASGTEKVTVVSTLSKVRFRYGGRVAERRWSEITKYEDIDNIAQELAATEDDVEAVSAKVLHATVCSGAAKPIRKPVGLFNLTHLFTKMKKLSSDPDIEQPKPEWTLWRAKPARNQPPFVIYDTDGLVSEATQTLWVERLNRDQVDGLLAILPPKTVRQIGEILTLWLDDREIFFKPVPPLRSPDFLSSVNWRDSVENELLAYETDEKDPRLKLVHKATCLRGIAPYINPHSLQVTNGGTGKSEFYRICGECIGKATARSFLGFAKSPDEIFPGIIDGVDLPVGIDQIESQSASEIARFLFNALESGEDTVSSGAAKFKVKTSAIFNFLANPMGHSSRTDPTRSFHAFIEHLSFNQALGRRIGIICYGNDFKMIRKKPNQESIKEWKQVWVFFRAIEEYCRPKLEKTISLPEIKKWLNEPLTSYEDQVRKAVGSLPDEVVQVFLTEHGGGAWTRIRAAALFATFVDMMDKIALDKYSTDEILDRANDLLSDYVNLNLESIGKISATWSEEKATFAKYLFNNYPGYAKDILSAIELWRRTNPQPPEILLNQIPYTPTSYPHFSQCISKLSKRREPAKLVDEFKRYFDIDLSRRPEGWFVRLLNMDKHSEIKPLGSLAS
jgi:hypothetical protein